MSVSRRRYTLAAGRLAVLALVALQSSPAAPQTHGWLPDKFTLFESGQVRPLALSGDGRYLYAVNTPDNRLEVFRAGGGGRLPLKVLGSVLVGLEPVALAVHEREIWVVNHLSDSVSIVDVSLPHRPRVVRTLLVGDEPRDIVFAGEDRDLAFITTAHRGQSHRLDPELTTPGVGRADVWVFDAEALGDDQDSDSDDGDSDSDHGGSKKGRRQGRSGSSGRMGGAPTTIITLFADTPRALAASPDGTIVYAASFLSGNRTTIVHDTLVTNGGASAPDGKGLPTPNTNFQGIPQPEASLVVRYDGANWVGPAGRLWDDAVRLSLPDLDVFAIDATADPPAPIGGPAGEFAGVGTALFNMAVNPVNGKVYVSNTEARNEVRFEGPGFFGGSTVRGRTHLNRITVIDGGSVLPRLLNKHIDFSTCCDPIPNDENDRSLAQPMGMAITPDGQTLYVAAFGSSKIGVFSTAELENDTFIPDDADHIELSGGGPTGIVLDERRHRLYVLTRFDNSIKVVDTVSGSETAQIALFNPEPESVVVGRPFLYDARHTSSRGNSSCASCHIFGDLDHLTWDLGDPDGEPIPNPGPFVLPAPPNPLSDFHPMKGPMATQSLRGLDNHGPMHWRGDRTGANDVAASSQPDTGLFDEQVAFEKFNVAFPGLVGRHEPIPADEMAAFARFALQIVYPPNPIRNLDNSLTESQARGRDHYFRFGVVAGGLSCNLCHVLDPTGNAEHGVERPGFFGSNGLGILEGTDQQPPGTDFQHFKIPHLRNLYQKVGMFGLPRTPDVVPHSDDSHRGDQIRGFGFTHDGSFDTLARFMLILSFSDAVAPAGFPFGPEGDPQRRDVEAFLLAYDSNLAPIVGQQVTLTAENLHDASGRFELLLQRASTDPPECELVVKGRLVDRRGGQHSLRHGNSSELGFLYIPGTGTFLQNRNGAGGLSAEALLALTEHTALTSTCVPPGSGYRMGLDADLDGCFDGSEAGAGSDPRDGSRRPPGCP